jgi:hypothetical protein
VNDLKIATFPLALADRNLRTHDLMYRNPKNNLHDYAFRRTPETPPIIPTCIHLWAEGGIDVSREFVEGIWQKYATKINGNRDGELLRCQKLVLDALRHVRDMAAFTELLGLQCFYQQSEDMAGRDLMLILPEAGPTWVQLQVNISGRFIEKKKERRDARGVVVRKAWVLAATEAECITTHRPLVPEHSWYARAVDNLLCDILFPEAESA